MIQHKLYKKVEGEPSLYRDQFGAVINTNRGEIEKAKQRKRAQKRNTQELANMKSDVEEIKQELTELKSLLKQLVEK